MPGSPVLIGPFTGGLNTYNDPTTISDTECVDLTNLDIDLDGSLVNRPPIAAQLSPCGTGGTILGTYKSTAGVTYFVIIDTANNLKVYDITSGTAAYTITTNVQTQAIVQYQNKLWIVATPNSANPGGSWDPTAGFVAVAGMARGNSAAIYKERLFVSSGSQATNPNRLNFSNPSNFSVFTSGTDFLDIANGDGQAIIKIYTYSGSIVIFKTNSTYTFGYDSQPSKGQADVRSSSIGLASPEAFVEYENVLYILYGNMLYSIANFNWDQVNVKVPFLYYNFKARTVTGNFSLSVVGYRLIIRYYDNYYIYGLKTKAFSLWRHTKDDVAPQKWFAYPILDTTTNMPSYFAGNYDAAKTSWYKLIDTPTSTLSENFDISLITKTYDYKVPYTYKRMFWWGADMTSKTLINFLVHPTVYNTPIKWSQISGPGGGVKKWSELKTWARPIDVSIDVTDSASTPNPGGIRTFIRLIKGLRFRQISFRVMSSMNGTLLTGPFRIFSLTAATSSKELVSHKIN